MSIPTFNTKSPTIRRILKEATELRSNPDSTLHASPLESNLFEWHFTIQGPPSTPYSDGMYHGRIILPPTYPLRPPSFRFLTPSGRFEVNREICLSISGHHEETWQPAWGIRTALWALRAFMEGGAKGQVGGMEMSEAERVRLARESKRWRCQGCGGRSNEEILKEEGGRCKGKEEVEGTKVGSREDVPQELRFGFRDEMGEAESSTEARPKREEKDGHTEKEREYGDQGRRESVHYAGPVDLKSAPPPIPVSPPPPLANRQLQQQQPLPSSPTSPLPGSAESGVPGWVDKAIAGVVAGLVVMIVKKVAI